MGADHESSVFTASPIGGRSHQLIIQPTAIQTHLSLHSRCFIIEFWHKCMFLRIFSKFIFLRKSTPFSWLYSYLLCVSFSSFSVTMLLTIQLSVSMGTTQGVKTYSNGLSHWMHFISCKGQLSTLRAVTCHSSFLILRMSLASFCSGHSIRTGRSGAVSGLWAHVVQLVFSLDIKASCYHQK